MAAISHSATGIREALLSNIAPYPLNVPLWEVLAGAFVCVFICFELFRLFQTKYFFFVRHGETLLNAQNIRQSASGALSARGVAQAESAGQFLAHFGIRLILASPYERTRQTAIILQRYFHCRVRYSSLLIERRNPSDIIGKRADEPEIKHIIDLMDLSFHDDTYRYSDEENFTDLKQRAHGALRKLARRGRSRTVVVTHKFFLHMLLAYIQKREQLHASDWVGESFFNPAENAGITLCAWYPTRRFGKTRGWKILTQNATAENSDGFARGRDALALNLLRRR